MIIGVVVLIVLVVGGFYFFSSEKKIHSNADEKLLEEYPMLKDNQYRGSLIIENIDLNRIEEDSNGKLSHKLNEMQEAHRGFYCKTNGDKVNLVLADSYDSGMDGGSHRTYIMDCSETYWIWFFYDAKAVGELYGPFGEGPEPTPLNCAIEREQVSSVYAEEYPSTCCEGLTEWPSGFDTGISIGDECYDTGMVSGSPVGTCINCGNGVCEDIESVCNCPSDCSAENSRYVTVADFCDDYVGINTGLTTMCKEDPHDLPLCNLCEWK